MLLSFLRRLGSTRQKFGGHHPLASHPNTKPAINQLHPGVKLIFAGFASLTWRLRIKIATSGPMSALRPCRYFQARIQTRQFVCSVFRRSPRFKTLGTARSGALEASSRLTFTPLCMQSWLARLQFTLSQDVQGDAVALGQETSVTHGLGIAAL